MVPLARWWRLARDHAPSTCRRLLAVFCAVVVLIDVIVNNWEINHFAGNGRTFLAPLFGVGSTDALERQFTFPPQASPSSASRVGRYMLNYSLGHITNFDATHYVLSAGSFTIRPGIIDRCHTLVQTYPVPSSQLAVNLGVIVDEIMFVRGYTLGNFFHGNDDPMPPGSNHSALVGAGYTPGRVDCEAYLTTAVDIPPPGIPTTMNISLNRYLNKAFCSGCPPVMEITLDICEMTMVYNDSANALVVMSSHTFEGEQHMVGVVVERTGMTMASLYVRTTCVVFVLVGYAISQRTVRWVDGAVGLTTWYKKAVHLVSPSVYRYRSDAFSFSYFCLNSDFFVVVYMIAVLLDEKAAYVYSRALFTSNKNADDLWTHIRMFSMNFRWMWLNCFVVKFTKLVVHFVSSARHTGTNSLVGFFNFSSVVYVYLGGVVLITRNDFLQFGNSDYVYLSTATQRLDGISLSVFDSTILRNYPSFALVIFVNLFAVLTIDRVVHYQWWRRVANNSLGRQLMFNSTSILTDIDYPFLPRDDAASPTRDASTGSQPIAIRVRALCTLQWFLTSHTMRFGLPEQPHNIRAMVSKSHVQADEIAERNTQVRHRGGQSKHAVYAAQDFDGGQPIDQPPTDQHDGNDQVASSNASTTDVYMVTQDTDGYIHLYNARKKELQALSLEVKILADANIIMA